MPTVDFRSTIFRNKPYPMKNEIDHTVHPLTEYKVFFPQEWEAMHRKVRDRVWFGVGAPMTELPAHLFDPLTHSLKSADLIEFKKSGKPIMSQLSKWQSPVRKLDAKQEKPPQTDCCVVSKMRKAVTMEERDPALSGNINYIDMRKEKNLKGANVLYVEGEEHALDDDERKRAGVLLENGKRVKIPPKPAKTLLEEPVRGGEVEDTWSMQGFSYYGFMIGGRYNRFDTFDDLLFRDYGILLPRNHPGRVFFTERIEEEDEREIGDQQDGQNSDNSSSILTSSNNDTSSSDRLRFTIPTVNSTSVEMNLTSSANTSKKNQSRPTTFGRDTTTARTTTTMGTRTSMASSAYYYQSNAKSVKALMDRLASTMATPKTGHGKYFGVGGNYLHAQQRSNQPRTILKGGGRGGRSFTFAYRPQPPYAQNNSNKANKDKKSPQSDANIDSLISLGYQLATSQK